MGRGPLLSPRAAGPLPGHGPSPSASRERAHSLERETPLPPCSARLRRGRRRCARCACLRARVSGSGVRLQMQAFAMRTRRRTHARTHAFTRARTHVRTCVRTRARERRHGVPRRVPSPLSGRGLDWELITCGSRATRQQAARRDLLGGTRGGGFEEHFGREGLQACRGGSFRARRCPAISWRCPAQPLHLKHLCVPQADRFYFREVALDLASSLHASVKLPGLSHFFGRDVRESCRS